MQALKAARKREQLAEGAVRVKKVRAEAAKKKASAADSGAVFEVAKDVVDHGAIVRGLGDHVNTRYLDYDDLDTLDAGIGMNHDDEGRRMIDDARTAAGERRRAVAEAVRGHTDGKVAPTAVAFIGHNRNTVTCVTMLDATVFYGDKTGHVFRADPSTGGGYARVPLNPTHTGPVTAIALSDTRNQRPQNFGHERTSVDTSVPSYLASGGHDGAIHIWRTLGGEYVGVLKLHRAPVTSLVFRQWSAMLVSASRDSALRLWSVPEMHCADRFYGHVGPITAVSALRKERCATGGTDRTVRHWKLDAATQVEFAPTNGAVECVAMLDDVHIVAGTATGFLYLYDTNRRQPLQAIEVPHGRGHVGDGTGIELAEGRPSSAALRHGNAITALAALPYGDLVASGSYSGSLIVWRFTGSVSTGTAERGAPAARLERLLSVPQTGCVNALHFSTDGAVLAAAVGKEQRDGRWLTLRAALNGVALVPLQGHGEAAVAACVGAGPRQLVEPLLDPAHRPSTAGQEKLERKRRRLARQTAAAAEASSSTAAVVPAVPALAGVQAGGEDAGADEADGLEAIGGFTLGADGQLQLADDDEDMDLGDGDDSGDEADQTTSTRPAAAKGNGKKRANKGATKRAADANSTKGKKGKKAPTGKPPAAAGKAKKRA